MVAAEPLSTKSPHPISPPATCISPHVPRLWPALPSATRRLLAQELARLLSPMRARIPTAVAPGTEAIHADHADFR